MSPVHVLQISPVHVLQMSPVHVLQMSPVHVLQIILFWVQSMFYKWVQSRFYKSSPGFTTCPLRSAYFKRKDDTQIREAFQIFRPAQEKYFSRISNFISKQVSVSICNNSIFNSIMNHTDIKSPC
jgi:hypothetical protein